MSSSDNIDQIMPLLRVAKLSKLKIVSACDMYVILRDTAWYLIDRSHLDDTVPLHQSVTIDHTHASIDGRGQQTMRVLPAITPGKKRSSQCFRFNKRGGWAFFGIMPEYTDEEVAQASELARTQAREIIATIVEQDGPEAVGDDWDRKKMIALVAYLQRLGTDIYAVPDEEAAAAEQVAAIEGAAP